MHPFVHYENYFDRQHLAILGDRWATFKTALNLFVQRRHSIIVETGSWRFQGDVGGGESTKLFCEFLAQHDHGHLHTVDLSPETYRACSTLTEQWRAYCTCYCEDSVAFLRNWVGVIELLYLDSYDYPYFELLDRYGQRDVPTMEKVKALGEAQVIQDNLDLLEPSQLHCLRELTAALPHLGADSIVLIDDNSLAGGGKSRLAKQLLVAEGWHCLLDFQQSLWIRG